MNVLILVLSARCSPWGELMDCSMETWDSVDHPQTKTLYYCGKVTDANFSKPMPQSSSKTPSTVFYSTTLSEELGDVSSRTIEAFEEAINLDYHWDFLARPNSSCYVHKKNLVDFCENVPWRYANYGEKIVCGVLTGGEQSFLWGGCHYIFSRDVVEQMVAYRRKWNHTAMDDQSITYLLRELRVPFGSNGRCASINLHPGGEHLCLTYNHGESFTFSDWADVNKLGDHFFVRCKYDPDRTQDLMTFRKLYEHWK